VIVKHHGDDVPGEDDPPGGPALIAARFADVFDDRAVHR
jgi:hypothetical protein